MQFLSRWWAQINAQLSQLSLAARWLIVSLVVILLFVAGALLLWVATPQWAAFDQYAADRQTEVLARLKTQGVTAKVEGNRIMVAADELQDAYAVLAQNDLLSNDTSKAFDDMIASQSMWESNQKSKRNMMIARQKVLSQIIRKMRGVHSADVMIDVPEFQKFGQAYVRPTASVNLVMQGSGNVDQRLVEAVAGLVSGAVADMKPEDVNIVDANSGRSMTVKDPLDAMAGELMERTQSLEKYYRDKIQNALNYIPGVIVAVNVRMDNVRSHQEETTTFATTEPLKETYTKEQSRTNTSNGGEPGTRSNTQLSINSGSSVGSEERQTEERQVFGEKPVTQHVQKTLVGGMTRQVNVTVNIPRRYFVGMFLLGKAADTVPPDDSALQPIVEQQIAQVRSQVSPLINAEEEGVVMASMVPDPGSLDNKPVMATTGFMALVDSSYTKPALLGALALISMALMFAMARKATAQPDLPSIEELAGVPPTLPGDDELVGEAEESDPGMAGVELAEDEIRARKIAEQISDMVKANPNEAANLIRKWVEVEQ
ncbi:MAG: hypothetical protein GC164_05470 [Phycisphaera sp.]|nr:hypothetical protein [Phycisphaera sp.]